jgi:hypothetical protein
MLVCDLCLLNHVVLVVSGLSGVHGTLGLILLSYVVHMHSHLRSLRQGQVHVGPITSNGLPHHVCFTTLLVISLLLHLLLLFLVIVPVTCLWTFSNEVTRLTTPVAHPLRTGLVVLPLPFV